MARRRVADSAHWSVSFPNTRVRTSPRSTPGRFPHPSQPHFTTWRIAHAHRTSPYSTKSPANDRAAVRPRAGRWAHSGEGRTLELADLNPSRQFIGHSDGGQLWPALKRAMFRRGGGKPRVDLGPYRTALVLVAIAYRERPRQCWQAALAVYARHFSAGANALIPTLSRKSAEASSVR